ncbi:MAG: 50S ribosomal protein L31e [Candidatus Bathyarchaeia archaeon]|jgi:large subunit ribosomal protein L31e
MVNEEETQKVTEEEEPPALAEEETVEEQAPELVAEPSAEAKPEEAVAEEEETKAERKKKEEEEIVEERTYTIPLGKALVRPSNKRASRAMQLIKIFITKHMKLEMKVSEEEEEEELPRLIISQEVNQKIWDRGIQKPPRKIKVRAAKDKDGNVTVYLA